MAKKKAQTEEYNETVIYQNLEDVMGDRFGRYSKYIIQERALPDARDGLKPVQRRIVFAMNKEGNTFDKPHRKSAKTVGIVIGNYHPHGDTSVYDAMVRLSQDWKVRTPLIDMHGNNGSIDDDPAAAMRYTEARMSKAASLLVRDLPYETVEMSPNFDDTEFEPTVLPSQVPTLLLNGSTGIAAGYATNIPPHNLNEVMEGVIFRLKKPKSTLDELMDIIKGPDFPTGGTIHGLADLKNAMKTGRGKVVVRAKSIIKKQKNSTEIIITEIPYEVVKQQLVADMDNIRINKEVDGIIDVRDESDKDGLRIVIEIKSTVDPKAVLNYMYKKTDLQVNYNFNMVAIVNKEPRQVGLIDLLDAFIDFRKEVITKRSKYLLAKHKARLEVLDGLIKAVSIMDKIIKTIRASKDKADVIKNLVAQFKFTKVQAEAIANMRLYRLSNTDIVELTTEKAELEKEIAKLTKILGSEKELKNVIVKESQDIIKEFGSPRRTALSEATAEVEIDERKLVQDETVMITVSKDGYLKRVSMRSFKSSDGETGIKEGDSIVMSCETSTLKHLVLLTDQGNYLKLPVFKIEEAKWKDIGFNITKYAKVASDKIVNCFIYEDYPANGTFVLNLTKDGMIKKTSIKEFAEMTKMGKIPALIKMRKDDTLVFSELCNNKNDIFFISNDGYANCYGIKGIAESNLNTMGLVSCNLGNNDEIKFAQIITDKTAKVSIPTDKKPKVVNIADVPKTKRGNKGKKLL